MNGPITGYRLAAIRAALFFGLWLVLLPSLNPANLAVGVIAAGLATRLSLWLLPASVGQIRLGTLLLLMPHLLKETIIAGFDVAWRAMAWAMCGSGIPIGPRKAGVAR